MPGRLLGNIRRVLFSRASVLLAVGFALYSLMFFALFSFLPVLLMERMDISYRSAGLLSALASVVNVSGNLAAGYLLTRGAGRDSLILFASDVMGASGIGIFLGWFEPQATFLLCLLFSAVGGLIPATLFSLAVRVAPGEGAVSTTVGWVQQWSSAGQFVGPPLVAWVAAQAGGWQLTWAVTGSAALLGALLGLRLRTVRA